MIYQMSLETVAKITSIAADISTIVALIFGALFAWFRWGREAPIIGRGHLSHEIKSCLLSESKRLVHVALTMKNVGTSTLQPGEAYTHIQQVLPLTGEFGELLLTGKDPVNAIMKTEFDWPKIGKREYEFLEEQVRIDSNESLTRHAEFIIPSEVKAIIVYSMVCLDQNLEEAGWDLTTFHMFEMNAIDERTTNMLEEECLHDLRSVNS